MTPDPAPESSGGRADRETGNSRLSGKSQESERVDKQTPIHCVTYCRTAPMWSTLPFLPSLSQHTRYEVFGVFRLDDLFHRHVVPLFHRCLILLYELLL